MKKGWDVRRHKDTNFWKQFTTAVKTGAKCQEMFAVTKIQIFESNSQQRPLAEDVVERCSPSQRYKFLKAIHNSPSILWLTTMMFAVTKIQIFESNSQLHNAGFKTWARCSPSQRYKFLKAIHNKFKISLIPHEDVRRHKDTNFWKQFTTLAYNGQIRHKMFAVTKIQIFESNSQLRQKDPHRDYWCSPSQRYKFLKAIHN